MTPKKIGTLILLTLCLSACASSKDLTNVKKHDNRCETVTDDKRNQKPLFRALPVYPAEALGSEVNGYVDFVFDISTKGRAINISVIESYPEDTFVDAATNALERYEYEPNIRNGKAVTNECQSIRLSFQAVE